MSILRRLSLNLRESINNGPVSPLDNRREGSNRGVPSSASFNDFSMHVNQELEPHHDDSHAHARYSDSVREVPASRRSYERQPGTGLVVGSAPAGIAPIATHARSPALIIPTKASVAAILGRMDTPRSSLDHQPSSNQTTPRASFSADESPRSPTSPGSRRRRQQKIHGLDYYEFCELVRAGSL